VVVKAARELMFYVVYYRWSEKKTTTLVCAEIKGDKVLSSSQFANAQKDVIGLINFIKSEVLRQMALSFGKK
jgi:hypothetical protein